jgi:hypothetical protein
MKNVLDGQQHTYTQDYTECVDAMIRNTINMPVSVNTHETRCPLWVSTLDCP